MSAVEVVDINEVKAIRAKRRRDIKRADAAVGAYKASTVEIADAVRECQVDEAYKEDEVFMDALARGTINLKDHNRTYLCAWCAFRYGFSDTHTFYMARAGELRAVLMTGPEDARANARALPATEGAYRSMTKALNPSYIEELDEVESHEDRDEAIRRIYRAALKVAEDDPVKAAKAFPTVARDDGYEPVARRFKGLTPAEKKAAKAARLERFRQAGLALIRQGRHAAVREVCEELLARLEKK
jgi:rubrerythrin